MCSKHLLHEPLSVDIYLFKFVCSIELSSNFVQEKKFASSEVSVNYR